MDVSKQRKEFLILLFLPLVLGGVSALITGDGMKGFSQLNQPLFSPPGWLFPVVWTLLYLMMGLGSFLVWNSDGSPDQRNKALTLYGIQLTVNLLWPILFFGFSLYLVAFLWLLLLWVLIVCTTVRFYGISSRAGDLMLPYLLWTTFAAYLNWGIYRLN